MCDASGSRRFRATLLEAEEPEGEVDSFESKRIAAETKFLVTSGRRGANDVDFSIVHRLQIVDDARVSLIVSLSFILFLFYFKSYFPYLYL